MDFRVLRRLVRRADARELGDLAFARLLVQAFGVARLSYLEREVDKDLDEGEWRVGARRYGVQVARLLAVGGIGRDERCDGDCGRVCKELGDLFVEPFVSFAEKLALSCCVLLLSA